MSASDAQPQRTLTPGLLGVMWMVLFGFGTFFINYATLITTGQHMGLTAVTAGTVLTTMMVAVVAVQPIVPLLNNRLGSRVTFFLALGCQAVGHLLSLLPLTPLVALLTGSVVGGVGFGVLVVIGTAVVPSTVAPGRLGRVLGFYGATTATATAIAAPVGLWLITLVPEPGFRWLNFALVLLALPAILTVPKREVTEHAGPHSNRQHHAAPRHQLQLAGLLSVLLPTALILTVFGLVLAFGPAAQGASPALYIAAMQVFVIVGRFLSSASLDRHSPVAVMLLGLATALVGLIFAAVLPAGWMLGLAMAILGFGTGTVQAASLLMAFQQSGSANRGSVAWNMTFDIGLGFAGLVGGIGFTYWGAQTTYLACALVLVITTLAFAWYFRWRRRIQ
ncbi:MFS transporter [Enteractinococcus coprophilus]|uniref:Putative MFS family arabinose efflux permease n=1 Tax=Enteractinococcus coprophilus TaxID=1027633 RepID=A0A543AF50_9MICC|nr:MFS transporter [Enteractinococcus coprophilus]TQL71201.1 putative MFS family arabinose efflux permease [Enteractinococcus coprophilus]